MENKNHITTRRPSRTFLPTIILFVGAIVLYAVIFGMYFFSGLTGKILNFDSFLGLMIAFGSVLLFLIICYFVGPSIQLIIDSFIRKHPGKRKTITINEGKVKKSFSPFSLFITFILIIYCFILIFLLVWAFYNSFKLFTEFGKNPIALPSRFILKNYNTAWNEFSIEVPTTSGVSYVGMPAMFLYGFLYAIGCSFAATAVPCIVGYLCAKYNYKFSKIIYFTVIIVMILPIVGNLPAEIKMAKTFRLYDHIWGMWIMKANFLGLYFIVFYNFFRNLPNAYSEAARIDGAGNFRILFKIILPLAMPLFFTVMLITFINFWNDYNTPLVYLKTRPTIAYGMYYIGFNGMSNFTIPVKIASAFLVLTPVLILFLIFHKKLLGNLTMGGIKG